MTENTIALSFEKQSGGICENCGSVVNELYVATVSSNGRTKSHDLCLDCAKELSRYVKSKNESQPEQDRSIDTRNAFCSNCGNPIQEGNTFCGRCGARIGESQKAQNDSQSIKKTITLEREKKFLYSAIIYDIIVDDKIVNTLRNGEKCSITVDGSKPHSLFIDSHNSSTLVVSNGYGAATAIQGKMCSKVIEIPKGSNPIHYFLSIKSHFSYSEIIITETRQGR